MLKSQNILWENIAISDIVKKKKKTIKSIIYIHE